jgi:hypothetical protein
VVSLTGCQNVETTKTQPGNISQLRIIVPEEGFFEITQKEWEEKGLIFQNPEQIQLEYKGTPYPFWVNLEPDNRKVNIRFYSPKIEPEINLKENVFILSQKASDHSSLITPLSVFPVKINSKISATGFFQEFYQNQSIYLPQVSGEDHWLWALMQPGQIIEQEFQLSQLPIDGVTIRCQFWITPTSARNSTQLVSVSINEHNPKIFQVEGQEWQNIEIQIDATFLSKKNTFSLQPVTVVENIPNKIYLDRIEIEYSNSINLNSQFQSFMVADERPLNITISSPGTLVAMDKTDQPLDIYSIQSKGQFNFVNQPDAIYRWIPDEHFLPVSSVQPFEDEILIQYSKSINYLVIAPETLQPMLLPLIQLRNDKGLSTMMVSPQQIYDTYNSGSPSPDSLKEFVQNVNEIDSGQLKFLLLVGDYSYEIVNYQEFINYVPSFFVNSGQIGQTISDFPFTYLNGNSKPELAVGRIPAGTPQQVAAWVDKVIEYENFIPSKWRKMIAISDPSDPNFIDIAQKFLLPFSDEYQTQIFNPPNLVEVQNIFKDPYTLIFYFGHGSIDLWGKDKILSSPMIIDLPESSAAPILISFSCLNGYFIHPDKLSLAEGLLFHPGGGVVGIMAPTGLTTLESQEKIVFFYKNKLQLKNYTRINDLIFPWNGKAFTEDSFFVENFETYIFFGDPAMSIPSKNH